MSTDRYLLTCRPCKANIKKRKGRPHKHIEEELSEHGDTKKSLREIGRELAAEIERVFEAKVNPGTLFERARVADRKLSASENVDVAPLNPGDSGDKSRPATYLPAVIRYFPSTI